MHNFIAYFRKGSDFLKSYWAKWRRKQVAFFHGRTVKVILSHRRIAKAANSKAFSCKLRDNTTHSKGLITWAGEAMRISSVLPAVLFLAWFNRRAAQQARLLMGDFHPESQLTWLAWLSYNRKVDFCCVQLRSWDLCKASQRVSYNQALSSTARCYALPLTLTYFSKPPSTNTKLPPPPAPNIFIPPSLY